MGAKSIEPVEPVQQLIVELGQVVKQQEEFLDVHEELSLSVPSERVERVFLDFMRSSPMLVGLRRGLRIKNGRSSNRF